MVTHDTYQRSSQHNSMCTGTPQVKAYQGVMPDFRCTMKLNAKIRCVTATIPCPVTVMAVCTFLEALHANTNYLCLLQVHLRVDTTLTNNKLDIVAYVARHLTLGDRSTSLAQEFQEVPCEVRTVEVERLGSKHPESLAVLVQQDTVHH